MILMLRPRSGYGQWISREAYDLDPAVPVVEYTDVYGNLCQRLVVPPGEFIVHTQARVDVADTIDVQPGAPMILIQNLPPDVLHFLLPSRYCQADQLASLAHQIAGDAVPGYDQVEAIRAWIQQNIRYTYGVSNSATTALDTLEQRAGVCRDFVHLGLALCRSLDIPARMVVGYLYQLDPMDLHAWFEAFVGGRWYAFDATQATPRGGRITVAYGRDASDVALSTQFGPAQLTDMRVWVEQAE
jgi:transglutaminase-like putative cysteine protease